MSDVEAKYSGMTTNERLYTSGLGGQFDDAAKAGKREEMVKLLTQVEIPDQHACLIADSILASPEKFGY